MFVEEHTRSTDWGGTWYSERSARSHGRRVHLNWNNSPIVLCSFSYAQACSLFFSSRDQVYFYKRIISLLSYQNTVLYVSMYISPTGYSHLWLLFTMYFREKMNKIIVWELSYIFVIWLIILTGTKTVIRILNKVFPIATCVFYFFIFRERGREGQRKGEKHLLVASCMLPTGDLAWKPGMCPDWE